MVHRVLGSWILLGLLVAGLLLAGAARAAPASADVCYKAYVRVDSSTYGWRLPWCPVRTGWSKVGAEHDGTFLGGQVGVGAGVWAPVPPHPSATPGSSF
jgi:hypothetical protein